MVKCAGLAFLIVVAACSSDDVPKAEAQALVKGLDAARSSAPDRQTVLVAQTCAEIKGCAKECAPGLAAFATAAPDARAAALVAGCAEAKDYVRSTGAAADKQAINFIMDRVSKFVTRAEGALGGDEKKQLNEARIILKL